MYNHLKLFNKFHIKNEIRIQAQQQSFQCDAQAVTPVLGKLTALGAGGGGGEGSSPERVLLCQCNFLSH